MKIKILAVYPIAPAIYRFLMKKINTKNFYIVIEAVSRDCLPRWLDQFLENLFQGTAGIGLR
jgi:hypothetical protein